MSVSSNSICQFTMVSPTSSLATEKISLIPIDLRDPAQHAEFKQQRIVCGWNYSDESLQKFIDKQEKKLKSLFWITIRQKQQPNGNDQYNHDITASHAGNGVTRHTNGTDDQHAAAETGNSGVVQPLSSPFNICAGHISLDSTAEPPDAELAREDRSIMSVSTFFILPEHRTGGLGRAAMDLVEILATQEPYGSLQCHTLALTTLSRRYTHEDSPEGRGVWKQFGIEPPPFSNVDWYQKLGYVGWKEEPRYHTQTLHGTYIDLIALFMRKRLRA